MVGVGHDSGPNRGLGEGYRLLGIGMQFAAGIIFFVLVGYAIDRWLGTIPIFTVTGTVLGATLSFINVYMKLNAMADESRERRKKETGV